MWALMEVINPILIYLGINSLKGPETVACNCSPSCDIGDVVLVLIIVVALSGFSYVSYVGYTQGDLKLSRKSAHSYIIVMLMLLAIAILNSIPSTLIRLVKIFKSLFGSVEGNVSIVSMLSLWVFYVKLILGVVERRENINVRFCY